MKLIDNFKIAIGALLANSLRSLLSLVGVIIGVFAVTALISLGEMATYGVRKGLEEVAGRSLTIQPQHNGGEGIRFTLEDVRLLSSLPVEAIPKVISAATAASRKGESVRVWIEGTVADLPHIIPAVELAAGRFFGACEVRGAVPVAVISADVEERVFGHDKGLGKTLKLHLLGGQTLRLTVVGVRKRLAGVFAGLGDTTVHVPYTYLWSRLPVGLKKTFDSIELKVETGVPVDAVEKRARRLLSLRYGKNSFQIINTQMFQDTLKGITAGLQALLGGIGALSLLVGGIGIMNIMLVSVAERTREIGLRKALGATSAQVRSQFLIESVLLTLGGGIIGVALAAAVLYAIVATVPFFETFILSPKTVILALGVSAAVGLFFGVWPADQAARLDPIDALRHE